MLQKEVGMSSHDCVNQVRKAFNTKKVGHAGTLDVAASGVLVLGVNKGTKIMQYLNQDDKVYAFTICFNVETDTLDHTGVITHTTNVQDFSKLDACIEAFKGTYLQTPPAYSAVKVKGKKLYEYARNHQTIPTVPAKETTIYDLKRTSEVYLKDNQWHLDMRVHCSKGVFVRKLALDLARQLNATAHTTRIHREKAGQFSLDQAVKLADLPLKKQPLLSLSEALSSLPLYTASAQEKTDVSHGKPLKINRGEALLRITDQNGDLIAVYAHVEGAVYKPDKVFIT